MTEKDLELLGIGNIAMQKALEAYGKKGYEKEEKDYFLKVYEYLKNNGYSVERFEEKLKTLRLKKGTEQEYGYFGAHYDEKNNSISYINEEDLYHETFHVATSGIEYKYIDDNGKESRIGTGLNEGIIDLLTQKITSNVRTNYTFQRICAGVIEKIYGEEIFKPYFEGSLRDFCNQFKDKELVMDLIEDLDEYTNVTINGKSQESMVESFSNVISDLVGLCETLPKEKQEEIVKYLDKEFKSDDMLRTIYNVERINNEAFNINNYFDFNPVAR